MDFSDIVQGQTITYIPEFTLESGEVLKNAPVAYKTWGKLNSTKDNVMVICHAFTGSADVEDWWGPLMGVGKAFDYSRYFIFCGNVMGSPYGSASPLTRSDASGRHFGPEFPLTTIRDDIRLHKLVLDSLGVQSIAVVIGGSMGGMAVLEWPLCTEPSYVRQIIPIATSSRHSAWGISWGETQRQSIYSDPAYLDGYYNTTNGQPKVGLAAARMAALLTYRSRDSFESRFGRKLQENKSPSPPPTPSLSASAQEALTTHNDGHRSSPSTPSLNSIPHTHSDGSVQSISALPTKKKPIFTAQSYLRYQGDKFTARFDANCYIHLSRKMDTHDIARGRQGDSSDQAALQEVLQTLPTGALVISIQTDGLFTPSEQRELADHIPGASLVTISSPDGHDGFLLEFEQINRHVLDFLHARLPELYEGRPLVEVEEESEGFEVTKTSTFGEAEADITEW